MLIRQVGEVFGLIMAALLAQFGDLGFDGKDVGHGSVSWGLRSVKGLCYQRYQVQD